MNFIPKLPDYFYEKKYCHKYNFIAGIDEAGRGALAGPVTAAAVILPQKDLSDFGINDSKKLTPSRRAILSDLIKTNSISSNVAFSDNIEIDRSNILKQTMKAMNLAALKLKPSPDYLLIDGNYFQNSSIPYSTIIDGDAKCISIASASILAKVARDKWMIETADVLYPQYGFAKHKGYGTKEHITAIKKYGICPIHRMTFLKNILEDNRIHPSKDMHNFLNQGLF